MPGETCSVCGAPAPEVRTAGTLAVHGWRMVITPPTPERSAQVHWFCRECFERRSGSSPLTGRSKG